jgi:tRNA A-37 threonylcarbamoyl transferase component Bud32
MGSCSSKQSHAELSVPIEMANAQQPHDYGKYAPPHQYHQEKYPQHTQQQQQQHQYDCGGNKHSHPHPHHRHPCSNRRFPQNPKGSSTHSGPPDGSRKKNQTVHFDGFMDREKTIVESMLENNKGLRMAEIHFHDLKLQKIIGAGAFGEVIKGTYCGTPVVVKRMLRNKITQENLRMFGDEIQLMMNLRHPNIVQFIGASWNSYSNICFVTEFLERGDLFGVLRDETNILTWAEPILRMTIDTSRGMAYLHSMKPPIIHRDLKSMNILVSSTWGTKVSDFGLSREKSVDETMSVTGTPLWLPPEMIRGERYTEKADVYSFGIVLSELDTRKIPYHDIKAKGARHKKVTGSTLMHMVAYENLRPSLSTNCMTSVRKLYDRCTADDQAIRPTFEEIVQVLEDQVRKETLMREVSRCIDTIATPYTVVQYCY